MRSSFLLTGVVAATAGAAVELPGSGVVTLPWTPSPAMVSNHEAARPPADTTRVKLTVRGMTCGACAVTARLVLKRADGVYRADVSHDSASAVVWYDSTRTGPERFIARLEDMTGYEAEVVEAPRRNGSGAGAE